MRGPPRAVRAIVLDRESGAPVSTVEEKNFIMSLSHLAKLGAFSLLLVACGSREKLPAKALPADPPTKKGPTIVNTSLEEVGLSSSALDRTVDPCDDFYQFACGGWLNETEIPADKSRWARSFSEIFERNEAKLRQILEKAAAEPNADSVSKQLGPFYQACMDEEAIEKAGLSPIESLLAKVKGLKSKKDITPLLSELHRAQIWAFFDIFTAQDFKDAKLQIAFLDQNGLGLPDRDYYLRDDEGSKTLRTNYVEHIQKMLELSGMKASDAKKAASDVISIETSLAKASKSRVERRNPASLYNKVDREGLPKVIGQMDWDAYFDALGFSEIRDISITSEGFFDKLNELLKERPIAALRSYFQWQIIHHTAPILPKAFVDEGFALESMLTGAPAQPERWKRCVSATDRALGELLARPFVEENFPGEAREMAKRMVDEISVVFSRELGLLDWMDDATRERALEKLGGMAYLVGYPDKWKSYDFAIDAKEYGKNVLNARAFDLSRELAKVGTTVDRDEWQMTPPTVNAYYDPQRNHMVFPAGILQPPFYGPKQSLAVNLGGMGMVVGHELTHGFDDAGSQFDTHGNLENWWAPEVRERFSSKTECIEEQYANYEALPGIKLNGKLTLGENIADNAGVMLAFEALQRMREDADERIIADGFTEEQQFFLATGQVWCMKARDEWAKMAVKVDPHSPPKFRVNGSLSNMPAFWEAFSCEEGKAMRKENACRVW